jgi:hypothetical protein
MNFWLLMKSVLRQQEDKRGLAETNAVHFYTLAQVV